MMSRFLEVVSKVSDENHDAGELEKAAVEINPPFVTHEQASLVAKPGEEPLDLPAMPVAAQHPAILQRCSFAIAPVGTDQLAVQTPHQVSKPICIIGSVRNQPLRKPAGPLLAVGQSLNHQGYFCGRCRGKGASHRKTLAVRHHHPLCSFALLGLSDAGPPFLAGAKLPSMKHCSQFRTPFASSWEMKLLHTRSQTPSSSQSRKRRQQVDALGSVLGTSLHRAPVLSTQRIPSSTSRSVQRGRPKVLVSGRSGPIRCQTLSVMNS